MKKIITISKINRTFLAFFVISNAAFCESVLICKDKEFNPATYDGQALEIKLNDSGNVTEVSKVEGSWFCDEGTVISPKVIKETQKATVYKVEFNCDEYNGRLIVTKDKPVENVRYQFSYADDEQYRTNDTVLTCKAK